MRRFAITLLFLLACAASAARAQSLDLDGESGGFVLPNAYALPAAPRTFTLPTTAVHLFGAGPEMGTFTVPAITMGYGNWAEVGYARNVHSDGGALFAASGFNIYHAKVQLLPDTWRKHKWIPAVAFGTVLRTNNAYVTGVIAGNKTANTGDFYLVATKLITRYKLPILLNAGLRGTNSQLYGLAGSAPDFVERNFGSVGFPIPLARYMVKRTNSIVVQPTIEASQQPHHIANLPGATIPTTLVYGVRLTRLPYYHWTVDATVNQLAGHVSPTTDFSARNNLSFSLTYRIEKSPLKIKR
jgi:hypothetical protein